MQTRVRTIAHRGETLLFSLGGGVTHGCLTKGHILLDERVCGAQKYETEPRRWRKSVPGILFCFILHNKMQHQKSEIDEIVLNCPAFHQIF